MSLRVVESHGWAPIGVTSHEYRLFKRSGRWSILPAYTIDGYITWEIMQGSFTAELFEEFMEFNVLPRCNPYPGERSIIIMDNASIHISEVYPYVFYWTNWQRLEDLCAAAGVKLEYLPPYSPDYNPIEESFAELKAWVKKNFILAIAYE